MTPELPIYKLIVTDDENIAWKYTALVDKPATAELFIAFKEQESVNHFEFKVANDEKRIVMGALMVANLPILRVDEATKQQFLVVLDEVNIEKALQKFFKQGNQKNVNEMHDPKKVVNDVYMYQAFIINKEMGINTPKGFNEVPDGSAFGVFKVDNDQVWQDIKAGKYKGFSIEGMFVQEPMTNLTDEEIGLLTDALEGSNLN